MFNGVILFYDTANVKRKLIRSKFWGIFLREEEKTCKRGQSPFARFAAKSCKRGLSPFTRFSHEMVEGVEDAVVVD